MTKKPLYNAAAAITYIVLVVSFIRFLGIFAGGKPDNTFLAPIGALSLLVTSVSFMAFVFFYQPLLLLIAGEQKQALHLFLKTVAIFAAFTAVVFISILLLLR
jgi:hypothetical protein